MKKMRMVERVKKGGIKNRIVTICMVMILTAASCFESLAAQNFMLIEIGKADRDYLYYFDRYSSEEGLMPIAKDGIAVGLDEFGYGDFNGNIVIPIHPNWSGATRFVSGIAIVHDRSNDSCYAINRNGEKVFDLEGSPRVGMLPTKPNGNIFYTLGSEGDKKRVMSFYDASGTKTKSVDLSEYSSVGGFVDGYANLSIIDGYREWDIFGTTSYIENEVPVASIDIYGNISNRTHEEHTYARWYVNDSLYLENVGNNTYVLKDENGNVYDDNKFEMIGTNPGNNRFVARIYKPQEELDAYINKGKDENERTWNKRMIHFDDDFMPFVVLEVSYGGKTEKNAAGWKQDSAGWWYDNGDGTYPTNQWKEIDGKQYYFGSDGYMLHDTTTPDGYSVDSNGVWVS